MLISKVAYKNILCSGGCFIFLKNPIADEVGLKVDIVTSEEMKPVHMSLSSNAFCLFLAFAVTFNLLDAMLGDGMGDISPPGSTPPGVKEAGDFGVVGVSGEGVDGDLGAAVVAVVAKVVAKGEEVSESLSGCDSATGCGVTGSISAFSGMQSG